MDTHLHIWKVLPNVLCFAMFDISGLHNIRGTDRDTSPYFYSYAILLDTPADDAIR